MRQYPLKITLYYLWIGIVWVIVTDSLIHRNIISLQETGFWQTAKAFAFILITSIVLFVILNANRTAIRRHELKFRGLFEHNPVPMFIIDAETIRFIAANHALTKTYGYSKDELVSRSVDILFKNSNSSAELRQQLHNQRNVGVLLTCLDKFGESHHVRCFCYKTVFDEKHAFYAILVDVQREVETSNQLKEVTWMQSHLVRRPLANIMGVVDLMKHSGIQTPDNQQLFDLLNRSVEELDTAIKEISTRANSAKRQGN